MNQHQQQPSARIAAILRATGLLSLALVSLAPEARGQCTGNMSYAGGGNLANETQLCASFWYCAKPPREAGLWIQPTSSCDPFSTSCPMLATINAEWPGNHQNDTSPCGGACSSANATIYTTAGAPTADSCGNPGANILDDKGTLTLGRSVTCSNSANWRSVLRVTACKDLAGCSKQIQVPLDFGGAAGCVLPPPAGCGDSGGPGAQACCQGPLGATNPFGGIGPAAVAALGSEPQAQPLGPGFRLPDSGPRGLELHWQHGGAGWAGVPETAAWAHHLGHGWSWEYAKRLVVQGDTIWLVTGAGTYRRFVDTDTDGIEFEDAWPSDEERRLTAIVGGYELVALDGTIDTFSSTGLWLETEDRFGNADVASYSSGRLSSVALRDGRRIDVGYDAAGRLSSLAEVGTDTTTSRTWTYTWTNLSLAKVDMPDGRDWQIVYDTAFVPRVVRVDLIPVGGGTARVEAAWAYDSSGFVTDTWKGATAHASVDATDHYHYDYPSEGVTEVTDPLGKLTTFTWDRESPAGKPRVLDRSGDCPMCGGSNEVSYAYDDANNPLRPSSMEDASGTITSWTYDADSGMPLTRTEADGLGAPFERTTEWEYHPTYPGLATFVSQPAAEAGCTTTDGRTTSMVYDASGTGPYLLETIQAGCRIEDVDTPVLEEFVLSTARDYTGSTSGLPTSIDPPRLGSTADATTFTLTANDQLVATRTDPDPAAAGATTTYTYDVFNRRIGVTDANGHTTETQYDDLDRVVAVIERSGTLGVDFDFGDPVAGGDQSTSYDYSTLGDLQRIVLPEGNAVFYVYDGSGRVVERYRRASAAGSNLEKTQWVYDDMGHRTREVHSSLVGGTTVTAATEWSYANGCQLNAVIHNPAPFGSGDVITSHDYDCEGRLWKTWDANHPIGIFPTEYTEYEYDALDRLVTVTQPWGGTGPTEVETTYDYDIQDHLVSVTDGEGNETTYRYSDRDLLMEEDSPVSGITRHLYNDGGELVLTKDARAIETTRTIDAAGRVTLIEYSGNSALDVAFTYGSSAVDDEIGRLVGITRHGETHEYEYDEFGRTERDGGLVFGYDKNGNRESIEYPDGLLVEYTFDFADREFSLTADPGGENLSVVSAASYLPAGPLSGLTFGNGRSESRAFTGRYFPEQITLEPTGGGSALLDWEYTTDDVGNPTLIDDLVGSPDRSYGYQDHQYFLTDAAGPWPGPLAWEYDQIGNRLSEERNSITDTYAYTAGASGNTALLDTITLGVSGTRSYDYTPAGHVIEVDAGANLVDFLVDEEGRLGGLERVAGDAASLMTYDGRGFLSRVEGIEISAIFRDGFERETTECWSDGSPTPPSPSSPCSSAFRIVEPNYDSSGLLHSLDITETLIGSSAERVLFLAGRPVAIARGEVGTLDVLYLTTDHLGTPIAACDGSGTLEWGGGFEPFGTDWLAGTSSGASENGVWLRFPGQWEDAAWSAATLDGQRNNGHRWYSTIGGSYSAPDPLGSLRPDRLALLYGYAEMNPLRFVDPLGLDAITDDPNMQDCFYCLLKRSGFGTNSFESAAWVTDSGNGLDCVTEGWRRDRDFAIWNGPPPAGSLAFVHTHPTRSRERRSKPEPSGNDKKQSDRVNKPVYTIVPDGIWKYDPATKRTTREGGANWTDDPKTRCKENKKC